MSGSSEKDPWGSRKFPRCTSSGLEHVMLLGCPSCSESQRKMGQVKIEPASQPARCLPAGLGKPHKAASPDGFPGVRLWLLPSSRNVERGRALLPSPTLTASVNGAVAWCSAEQLRLLDREVPTSLGSKTRSDGSVEWERSAG